ncbi:hypothetical protein LUZ60_016387 [Juncus effusus]|nr:hypothetical protein LUZ60_016387 [Juncus effusus]
MEPFHLILVSLCLCTLLAFLFTKVNKKRLPPGPTSVPVMGNLLWLHDSLSNLEQILRKTHARYGPIVTLRVGSFVSIFISDRHIAHKMLIQNGATFASRPPLVPVVKIDSKIINKLPYGPLWRLLRRNLMTETLHPSRVKLFSPARSWVLSILNNKLLKESKNGELSVEVMGSFQFAMFSLLVFMCFGERLDEESVKAIGVAERDLLLYDNKRFVFRFAPFIAKFLFRNRFKTFLAMTQRLKDIYIPLINERREHKNKKERGRESQYMHSYVDALLDIKIPEEGGRNLTDDEIVGLCSEFLTAGTDTTFTALQWIMAELVKHQEIQKKLFSEIEEAIGENTKEEIKEEDLHKFSYLKAVILEGLRRHPPGHFVLQHAVTEETTVEGYTIPKNAAFNFEVAEMGWDDKVWPDPMEFKPERFLEGGEGEGVDITGSREIKMMPFGAGRRICPAVNVALLHLEYFVVNLVKEFEWKSLDGEVVDFSEKKEFTVVMKNPLKARIIPRRNLVNV